MTLDDPIRWTRGLATGDKRESGTLRMLLLRVLQSMPERVLPPRPLFNQLLLAGRVGGGMSGGARWKGTLQLPEDVYDTFRSELSATHRLDTSQAQTMDEWTADVYADRYRIDRAEHLHELQLLTEAEARPKGSADVELLLARQRYMAYFTAALTKARG